MTDQVAQQGTYKYEGDFQKSIVSAALQDPKFLVQYNDVLLPGYLDHEYLSSILRVARELTERLEEVPTKLTLVEELKEFCTKFNLASHDRESVLNLTEELYSNKVNNLDYIQDRVVDFGQRQALRAAIMKIVTLFQSGKGDVHEKARKILDEALTVGLSTSDMGLDLYPSLINLPSLAAKSPSGKGKKVPTMIPTLDKMTHGGPGRGEVWVVVGLPGRGKSTFLVNIGAAGLKNGFCVVHFTIGDLNEIDVGVRYAARLTMSSTYDVVSGSEAYLRKASKVSRYNPHLFIKYYPSATATMDHLRAYVSRIKSLHEVSPAIIIIDYPEELKRQFGDNLYLGGEHNYSYANKLAADFDSTVWLASQPKQWKADHPKDVIKGEDMGESRRKFQKVDGMVSWNMSYEEEMMQRGRLWVDKTRRDKSFYLVHMETDLERMVIREGKPPESTEC